MNVSTARTSCIARPVTTLPASQTRHYSTFDTAASLRMATVVRAASGDASAPAPFNKEAFDAERLKLDEQVTETPPTNFTCCCFIRGSGLFVLYFQWALGLSK